MDRILRGAKPADLPVEQPKKFEFIINLKAAKQTSPPAERAGARGQSDQMIEESNDAGFEPNSPSIISLLTAKVL